VLRGGRGGGVRSDGGRQRDGAATSTVGGRRAGAGSGGEVEVRGAGAGGGVRRKEMMKRPRDPANA
jgi:hypothetical protein